METKFDAAYRAVAECVVRWRWAVLGATLAAVAVMIAGGQHLAFTSDYRVFFGEDNPQLQAYEALQDTYTKTDNILIVLKPGEGTVFTPERLETVRALTEEAWQVPYSIRVDSITNYQNTRAEGDDLVVADLVEAPRALEPAAIEEIRRTALGEPALADRLISGDARTTAVQVTLQLPTGDAEALKAAVLFAEGLADEVATANPGMTVAVTGLSPLSYAFTRASEADMQLLIPIMFGIIVVALLAFLRSPLGTVATLTVTLLSAAAAMGVAGWVGIRLTPPSAIAPTIILTIAIADCVHILVSMFHEMRQGRGRHAAIVESLRVNAQPVFLTSLTTAIGFMSLNFSDAPPFHDLGNIAAVGVGVAWLLSMTFLPALMAILPVRVRAVADGRSTRMDRLADFVIVRRRALLIGVGIAVVATASMSTRIQLDDRFIEYFDRSVPFRVASDFTRDNLTGLYQIDYSIGTGETGGIADPAYLATLEDFATWLRAQEGVVHVNTLTDVMKRLNRSMHGDAEDWYRLPEARDLAAQYLLLYEMSLPYGLDLNSQIDIGKSASRLTVTLSDVTSADVRDIADRGTAWLARNGTAPMVSEGTGAAVMFAHISDRNIRSMLFGTAFAFLLISVTMIVALRSLRIGLVSLIPNMVPAAVAFGLWGLFVGQVGMGVSVVAATSLGLIVDASVHLLSKYLRARRERGLGAEDAVRYSFRTVGTALWVTTAVLVAGFAVLSLSSFRVNADMGLLTAIAIAAALVVDFLLLPPLLLLIDRRRTRRQETAPADENALAEGVRS